MATIDNINCILRERGMTGADLSRLIGVSTGVYSQWNTGTTKPSPKSISKIAAALDVSVDYLLTGEQKENPAAHENDGENVFELAIKNLCGDDQEKLALLMDSLSKNPEKTKASFDLFLKTL